MSADVENLSYTGGRILGVMDYGTDDALLELIELVAQVIDEPERPDVFPQYRHRQHRAELRQWLRAQEGTARPVKPLGGGLVVVAD